VIRSCLSPPASKRKDRSMCSACSPPAGRSCRLPRRASDALLLDQIAAGALDLHLVAIAEAVRARHELLHTINPQKALAMLTVGERVRINHALAAAAAPQRGFGVLHYAQHFDRLATVLGFTSQWVAPAGSIS